MITLPFNASAMDLALEQARLAAAQGEVPVGAVIVDEASRRVIAAAGNESARRRDPTAHAEMVAIRRAAAVLGTTRLIGCSLYVTLEPCAMCAGGISLARLDRLYFGAADPKGGGVLHGGKFFQQPTCHHRPEVYEGISENDASELLKSFFRSRR